MHPGASIYYCLLAPMPIVSARTRGRSELDAPRYPPFTIGFWLEANSICTHPGTLHLPLASGSKPIVSARTRGRSELDAPGYPPFTIGFWLEANSIWTHPGTPQTSTHSRKTDAFGTHPGTLHLPLASGSKPIVSGRTRAPLKLQLTLAFRRFWE